MHLCKLLDHSAANVHIASPIFNLQKICASINRFPTPIFPIAGSHTTLLKSPSFIQPTVKPPISQLMLPTKSSHAILQLSKGDFESDFKQENLTSKASTSPAATRYFVLKFTEKRQFGSERWSWLFDRHQHSTRLLTI